MTTPPLTLVDDLCTDVAAGDLTPGQALAILRARGLTPDPAALADAVDAIRVRDGLAGGMTDPLTYLDTDPRPGLSALDVALARCEADLDAALRVLARRTAVAVAS